MLSEYTTDVYVTVLELPKSCTVSVVGGLGKTRSSSVADHNKLRFVKNSPSLLDEVDASND